MPDRHLRHLQSKEERLAVVATASEPEDRGFEPRQRAVF
jgi:hypothetical protein